MKKRYLFWDNYKGVLIFLVVLGHFLYSYALNRSNSFANDVFNFIYMFHMPAFVFCSGYLSKSERSRGKEALTQLFLYYIIFNTGMMLFRYFDQGSTMSLFLPYYSYWYLLSLIVWRFVIGDLATVKGIVPISLCITLLMGFSNDFSNVLSIRRTFAFFIFFLLGYLMDREKFEKFLDNRKISVIILGFIGLVIATLGIFFYLEKYPITLSMTLMGAYENPSEIFTRMIILAVSFIMIALMILAIPNRKIPFLTTIGKNSLLIYLVHRFLTFSFNEYFPYNNYSYKYLIYAGIASIIVCIIFGNEKLNSYVSQKIALLSKCIADEKNKVGNYAKLSLMIVFVVLLGIKAPLTDIYQSFNLKNEQVEITPEPETDGIISVEKFKEINDSIKIAYVGDLILLKDQVTTAYNKETGKYDFSSMFEYATPYLSDADYAIGVYEGPSAGGDKGYSTSNYGDGIKLFLNFPDEFAQAVKNSGIDFVTTANNHLLDMGIDGAMRTLDVLDDVGLDHTGSYRNMDEKETLKIIEVDGVKIAVLSYMTGTNYYKAEQFGNELKYVASIMPKTTNPYYDELMKDIENDFEQAKNSDADLIMVMAHMGSQFKHTTNNFQNKFNQLFADLGADIVLGDHAHAVQPIEYINDTLVVNCPGNFANSYIAENGDATAIVEIYIDRETKKVNASSVIPMYTQEFEKRNFRAVPIISYMTDDKLYNSLTTLECERIKEVQELVTKVMVGESVSIDDVQERYYFVNGKYSKPSRSLFMSAKDYSDKELYKLIDESKKVVFIGDSITAGSENDGHPWFEPMMNDFNGKEIQNIAVGGYTTKRIISEFGKDILNSDGDLYVIAIGTNDVRYRNAKSCAMDEKEYIVEMGKLVEIIKKSNKNAQIVFMPPWTTLENDKISKLSHEEKIEMMDTYGNALKQYADENNFVYISPNEYLREFFKNNPSKLYTKDGIHPNSTIGVELYSKAVLESSN